ncbi:hypothetical protein QUA00_34970 [Microcoleus sp. T2B6]
MTLRLSANPDNFPLILPESEFDAVFSVNCFVVRSGGGLPHCCDGNLGAGENSWEKERSLES